MQWFGGLVRFFGEGNILDTHALSLLGVKNGTAMKSAKTVREGISWNDDFCLGVAL